MSSITHHVMRWLVCRCVMSTLSSGRANARMLTLTAAVHNLQSKALMVCLSLQNGPAQNASAMQQGRASSQPLPEGDNVHDDVALGKALYLHEAMTGVLGSQQVSHPKWREDNLLRGNAPPAAVPGNNMVSFHSCCLQVLHNITPPQ